MLYNRFWRELLDLQETAKTDKFTNHARDQEGPFLHHRAPPVPSSIDRGPRRRDRVSSMFEIDSKHYQWEISLHRASETLFVLFGSDNSWRLPTSASQVLNPALESLVPCERTDVVNDSKHKFFGVTVNTNEQGVVHDIDALQELGVVPDGGTEYSLAVLAEVERSKVGHLWQYLLASR